MAPNLSAHLRTPPGCFLREAADRIGADDPPLKINALMNWTALLQILKHGLSALALERALKVRFDFMLVCGLSLQGRVSEESTHSRFRHSLVKGGVHDVMRFCQKFAVSLRGMA